MWILYNYGGQNCKLQSQNKMIPNVVACNATNSAAVDSDGNVWVWGAQRHGLLGSDQDVNQTYPKELTLFIGNKTEEERLMRDKLEQPDSIVQIDVKEIAMGQGHLLALGCDQMERHNIPSLGYAKDIFECLRIYLLQRGKDIVKEKDEHDLMISSKDIDFVEMAIQEQFENSRSIWPNAYWPDFIELLFNKGKYLYKKNTHQILEQLQQDLSTSGSYQYINLRLLRNQIFEWKKTKNVVFGWGINDERLCQEADDSDESDDQKTQHGQKRNKYLSATMLYKLNRLKVKRIACGDSFSLALTQNGSVYSWGIGQNGSLGLGDTCLSTSEPRQLQFYFPRLTVFRDNRPSGIDRVPFKAIACGQSHCMALTETGAVFSWGCGLNGRLGHGDQNQTGFPEQIVSISHLIIEDIACGDAHSACITEEGIPYIWGCSDNNKLGFAEVISTDKEIPHVLEFFNIIPIKSIFLGLNNSFVVTRSNEVYVWGSSSFGKFGIPRSSDWQTSVPFKMYLRGTQNVYQIVPGPFHTMLLSREGELYVFGSSNDGKLGIYRLDENMVARGAGNSSGYYIIDFPWQLTEEVPPKFYKSLADVDIFHLEEYQEFNKFYTSQGCIRSDLSKSSPIIQIVCTENNTYTLFRNGRIFANGKNNKWQCTEIESITNDQDETVNAKYLEMTAQDRMQADFIKKQAKKSLTVKKKNTGQHKIADNATVPVIPVQVRDKISQIQLQRPVKKACEIEIIDKRQLRKILVRQISAGPNHALAISTGYQVYAWGDNNYGQLGLGWGILTDQQSREPLLVESLATKEIVMTASGQSHSLFLTREGRMYCCGLNAFGELGIEVDSELKANTVGTQALVMKCKNVPVLVDFIQRIRFIAAGGHHSLAISTSQEHGVFDSKLYSWGLSEQGQLGHFDVKSYNITEPREVRFTAAESTKIVFVSASLRHTLCIDTEGHLWFFGDKESVGIIDKKDKFQFAPKRLHASNANELKQLQSTFRFVAAGENNNIVLTKRMGHVFCFGKDIQKRQSEIQRKKEAQNHNYNKKDIDEQEESKSESDEDGEKNSSDEERKSYRKTFGGEEALDLNLSETFFQRQLQDGNQIQEEEAFYCSVGQNHQIVLQSSEKTFGYKKDKQIIDSNYLFVWGNRNDYGQMGLLDDKHEIQQDKDTNAQQIPTLGDNKMSKKEIFFRDKILAMSELEMDSHQREQYMKFLEKPQAMPMIDRQVRLDSFMVKQELLKQKKYKFKKVENLEKNMDQHDLDENLPNDIDDDVPDRKANNAGSYDDLQNDKILEKASYKFKLQYNLHQTRNEFVGTNMVLKKDDEIVNKFNIITADFHSKLRGRQMAVDQMLNLTQDALIYRIQNFPANINRNELGHNTAPKILIRSKQIFEGIFTYLQSHPCYIIKWIEKIIKEPVELEQMIFMIFGQNEIRDNLRVINTLTVIARQIFDKDWEKNTLQGLTALGQDENYFRMLFKIIMRSQSQNKFFENQLIRGMVHKVRKLYGKYEAKQALYMLENNQNEMGQDEKNQLISIDIKKVIYWTLQSILENFNSMDSVDVFHKLTKKEEQSMSLHILSLTHHVFQKLDEKAKTQADIQDVDEESDLESDDEDNKDQGDENDQNDGSDNSEREEEIKENPKSYHSMRKDKIQPYLMNMLFENLLTRIDEITFEDIKFSYWDYEREKGQDQDEQEKDGGAAGITKEKQEPRKDVFDKIFELQIFAQISQIIRRYFSKQYIDLLEDDKPFYLNFIKRGYDEQVPKRKRDRKNYREEIDRQLFRKNKYKPIAFDYLLVTQQFTTSLQIDDPIISVKIKHIVKVYNTLVDHKEIKWLNDVERQYDPLTILRESLGGNEQILLSTEGNANIGEVQMNLRIKCRFLVKNGQTIRCNYCAAPVNEHMIQSDRFIERYEGDNWKCANSDCKTVVNMPDQSRCYACKKIIPVKESHKLRDSVFERYKRLTIEEVKTHKTMADEYKKQMLDNRQENGFEKRKEQINLYIHVLRNCPRIHRDTQLTLREILLQQMVMRDTKYNKREEDMKLRKSFEKFIDEIVNYKNHYLDKIDRNLRKQQRGQAVLNIEMQLKEGERLFLKLLNKMASRKIRKKREHTDKQIDYGQALVQIQIMLGKIFRSAMNTTTQLDKIFYNSYKGIASPFLVKQTLQVGHYTQLQENLRNDPQMAKDMRKVMWAGSLHMKNMKNIKRKKEAVGVKIIEGRNTEHLRKFFEEIRAEDALMIHRKTVPFHQSDAVEIQRKVDDFKKEILDAAITHVGLEKLDTTVGQITFKDCMTQKILKLANLTHYEFDESVLLDSTFILTRDAKGGFYVEQVFQDKRRDLAQQQISLHKFYLSQEEILEMRNNWYCNAVFINGNLQFRVYQFVKLLNSIISKTNVYQRLNAELTTQEEKKKLKLRRDKEKNRQAMQEKLQSNLAMLL